MRTRGTHTDHAHLTYVRASTFNSQKNHTNVRSKMASFYVEAIVRGYHVYQDIWTTVVGKKFPCKREAGNAVDPFAVAVMRGTTVQSSVMSREGSHPFAPSFCEKKKGSTTCQVTGQTDRTHIEGQRSRVIECSVCTAGIREFAPFRYTVHSTLMAHQLHSYCMWFQKSWSIEALC